MKTITLNDGNTTPQLGFGTYKSTEQEGIAAVKTAIKKGYRLIDTAAAYGNEAEVGKGIKESGISRKELFVTTKLWRESLGYESTKIELEASLKRLDLEYIDLYLIHWPANQKNYTNWKKTNAETWKAMEELQAEGKIKSIGVSNFFESHLDALLETAKVVPAVNQIEFHPGYWQPELVGYCKSKNIAVESWSPLARGKVFDNPELKSIAEKHNKSVSQICLRWILQHQAIVIPKSSNPDRIAENIDVFDFELSNTDMELINTLPEFGFSGELPDMWPDKS
ncbi:oxidoreductase of aldo/keto reductase family, subgroup 1 [Formosa agariphila KMM 3901]|uniref:Oxidoreductase of aldo/keto reductase family, subgroup 1 n=1 Tax=Formosa agariphila (strain DSM 15362 / KCTC 12365 / LMG 23005 / KMM 3901 / M-2Alg 35-1) TaxID=1347342 RepID=T2KH37_FORAG|nr:aldo/keto reductase [Formosa agariphila]CDF77716.1 oxidoreductase of aldo/keto reductase family, subgroup 1 [Formosa agariphila KMM 3901]